MKVHNNRAFTLVETLITVLISSVVMAGVYSTYIVGNRAWGYYRDTIAARKEVRRVMMGMVRELRQAENVRVIQGRTTSAVHFYIPSVGPVSYVWSGSGPDQHSVVRRDRYRKQVLARYVSAMSAQKSRDAVIVGLTASKKGKDNVSQATLRERVALRLKTPYFR